MAKDTGIGWTHHTFNPWWGCQRVSPGCEHCYAEFLAVKRRKLPVWGPPSTTTRKRTAQPWKDLPAWDAAARRDGVRQRVFCASMADIFEDHPDVVQWRADALALLEACTNLDLQLLTKRPENILEMVPSHWRSAWPAHVWAGTTVEDQRRAEERIPHLLNVPAAVRFLSCEPLLESVYLRDEWLLGRFIECPDETQDPETDPCRGCNANPRGDGDVCGAVRGPAISWVIVGGESGPGARTFDLAWLRSILRQCREAGVPCFVKQLGACASDPINGLAGPSLRVSSEVAPLIATRLRDRAGADSAEWPAHLRVQEFPCTNV